MDPFKLSNLMIIGILGTSLYGGYSEIQAFTLTDHHIAEQKRANHVRELVSVESKRFEFIISRDHKTVKGHINEVLSNSLPVQHQGYKKSIAESILKESKKHGYDPMFLLAIIENESHFGVHKVGDVGEIGLMQIRPSTAKWITKKLGIPYKGKNSLYDPKENIKIGAAYMKYLKKKFENKSRLYLSAYNMGPTSVYRALKKNVIPKDYALATMRKYTKYYRQLHVAAMNQEHKEKINLAFMSRKLRSNN